MDATRDALQLLRDDHRTIVELFTEVDEPREPVAGAGAEGRKRLFERISEKLSRHATAEEELLYPLVRRTVPDGDALADEALEEHQQVKETLARMERMSADNLDFDGHLRDLMTAVRAHIDDEEGRLLPLLARHLDPARLDALGSALAAAELTAPTRPHPNAPNRPPFNVLAGAGAAVVDRVRDAASGRGKAPDQPD